MNKGVKVVSNREFKRVFSDRRLIMTLFILPFLSIFVIYLAVGIFIVGEVDQQVNPKGHLYIANLPASFQDLMAGKENSQLIVEDLEKDDVQAYREILNQETPVLIIEFPENFEKNILEDDSSNATVYYYFNADSENSQQIVQYFKEEIMPQYKQRIDAIRMGKEEYQTAMTFINNNEALGLNHSEGDTNVFGQFIPFLLSIFLFAGAMSVGIESITGEKERGTMATMLITPVPREQIVLGKILSLSVLALLSAISSFLGIALSIWISIKRISNGGNFIQGTSMPIEGSTLSTGTIIQWGLWFLILTIAMVFMFVGIVSLVSVFSKSVKEANTYITPIYMVVMICGFFNLTQTGTMPYWQHAIPIYGQLISLRELLSGELTSLLFMIALISGLVWTSLLVYIIRSMFNNEKYMFSS